jgi:hypothetical protein
MRSFFMSERFHRALPWIAGLLLVAGVVAVLTVRVADDDKGETARPAANAQPAVVDAQAEGRRGGKVEPAARVAAGQFILAAAGRENLKKAWALSHPELRDQCACSYKQWLTGNIPVPYYPVGNIEGAAFSVEEVTPKRTSLLVALLPKEGAKVKGQTFWIELKKTKQGKKQRWLVNYFQPYAPDTAGTYAPAE